MRIPGDVLEAIRHHLEESYPSEGCGLLLGEREGTTVRVVRHLAVMNRRGVGPAARRRYLISPSDYRRADALARSAGLVVLGTFHSHPDAPAVPSAYDRDHAWPWYQYLIVSVRDGGMREARAWELSDDRTAFLERPIE